MTTPNSTTESGVTEAEVEAAYRIILADGDAMLTKIQRALEGFAASRPVAGALPEVPDARTFNAMQRPGWAATSDWNRGWDACRSVFAAVNGLATPSPAQAEPTGEAAEQRANLDRYLKSNYPNAKGNSVTARAIHALEEMDVALGMKDMEAGKFTAEPTGAAEGAEPTADAEREPADFSQALKYTRLRFFRDIQAEQRAKILISLGAVDEETVAATTITHAVERLLFDRLIRDGKLTKISEAIDAARAAQKGQP